MITNADTCLCVEAYDVIESALDRFGCCYSHRRNFESVRTPQTREGIQRGRAFRGIDLWAFRWDWYVGTFVPTMPDLYMGREGIDWAFKFLMGVTTGIWPEICYHEYHSPYWLRHRTHDLLNQHNRREIVKWVKGRGEWEQRCLEWPELKGYENE